MVEVMRGIRVCWRVCMQSFALVLNTTAHLTRGVYLAFFLVCNLHACSVGNAWIRSNGMLIVVKHLVCMCDDNTFLR
jgi:hypothetical protein